MKIVILLTFIFYCDALYAKCINNITEDQAIRAMSGEMDVKSFCNPKIQKCMCFDDFIGNKNWKTVKIKAINGKKEFSVDADKLNNFVNIDTIRKNKNKERSYKRITRRAVLKAIKTDEVINWDNLSIEDLRIRSKKNHELLMQLLEDKELN